MLGQPVDLLGQPVGSKAFESLHDVGVQRAPSLLQQTAVGDLVRQGVLEGVFALWEEAGLVQELSGLQMRQAAMQGILWQLGNGLQQGEGHLVCQ